MGKIDGMEEIKGNLVKIQQQLSHLSHYENRTELLNIYDDYNKIPPQVQKELPFIDYLDFHLKLQNKNDMTRKQFQEQARELLAQEAHRELHEELSSVSGQPSSEPNLKQGMEGIEDHGTMQISNELEKDSAMNVSKENTSILFGDMEVNLEEWYDNTKLENMSILEEEQMDPNVGRLDDLAHVELEDISENVLSLGDEKSENAMGNSPLVFEGDGQKPLSLLDLLDMLLVKEDKLVQVLTRMDDSTKLVEDLMRKIEIEERHGNVCDITSPLLHTIFETLKMIKYDYLHLLMDRDLAIKFGKDKESEVDELCLQLSLTHYSIHIAENQTSGAATLEEDNRGSRAQEITQIIEGIHKVGRCEGKQCDSITCSPSETFYDEESSMDQQVDEFRNSDFYDSSWTFSHEHMVSDTTSEDNSEISINDESSLYEGFDISEGTDGGEGSSDLSLACSEGFFSLPRDISPSSYEMVTAYLLIGDFTCWYIPAISDLPAYVSGMFADSFGFSRINELLIDEQGEHTLPIVPQEVSTFFIQQHVGDSVSIHDVGVSPATLPFTQDHGVWVIGDPGVNSILHLVDYVVLLPSYWIMICVLQPSHTSEFQRLGLSHFHQGDMVVETDWSDLSFSSVQILQELVSGISDSVRVLIWDPGGAPLCIVFRFWGARWRVWLLSLYDGYWYIVELPSSLDSGDSQCHSWSEAFFLTEGIGTPDSSIEQLVSPFGETWDPDIQLLGTLIPIVLFHLSEFGKIYTGVHRLRSRTSLLRRVWDPGILGSAGMSGLLEGKQSLRREAL